jgi:hypothetical protein
MTTSITWPPRSRNAFSKYSFMVSANGFCWASTTARLRPRSAASRPKAAPHRTFEACVRYTNPLLPRSVTFSDPDPFRSTTSLLMQMGPTARVTALDHVPRTACTRFTSISFRTPRTAASGFVCESSWKSWSGRPSTPPALLIRSTWIETARCMSGP